jgi:hypothetical protein
MERQNIPSTDTVFVFDSDVVPYRVHEPLDHWTDFEEDVITLYTRTWSNEIAAGNYAVRNTVAGREFLRTWAGYEYQQPPGFSSADNGALHVHLLRFLNLESKYKPPGKCGERYRNLDEGVTNLTKYWAYVDCTRELLPADTRLERKNFSTRILSKDTGFVMDGTFDGYGVNGHGPAGAGPIFHHGIKINKTGVLGSELVAKYNLTMAAKASKEDKPHPVSCGQHAAASCGECSQGQGASSWCNGDCHWCELGKTGNYTTDHLSESDKCITESEICRI